MKNNIIIISSIAFFMNSSLAFTADYFSENRIFDSIVSAPKGLCVGEFNQDAATPDGFVALSSNAAIGQLGYSNSEGFYIIADAQTIVGANPISVAAADFTGSGNFKIATFIQDSAAGLRFYTNSSLTNGVLTFSNELGSTLDGFAPRTIGGPEAVAVGLLNADNNSDVISVGDRGDPLNASIYAYYNISAPTSSTFELSTSRGYPNSIAITDYNLDGIGDYVVTSTGKNAVTNAALSAINVFLATGDASNWSEIENLGTPTFLNPDFSTEVGTNPWGLAVADINGDGYPDVVTADRGSNSVSIVFNKADGTRASTLHQTLTNVCDEPIDVELADFNADAISDVAVLCTGDGFLKVYPGTASGTFGTTAIFEKNMGTNPFDIVTADFNNDGHADLLVSVTGSNKIVTILGNDEPTLSNPSVDTATGVFQIIYTDADNEAPASITVTIDGTITAMTETDDSDTTYTDGKIYQATQALSTGNHTYRFAASDGTYDAVGDPSSIVSADQSLTVSPAAGSGGGCSLSVANSPMSALACFASVLVLGASRILRRKEKHSS